jgi:hypothetical protein
MSNPSGLEYECLFFWNSAKPVQTSGPIPVLRRNSNEGEAGIFERKSE